MNIINFDSRDWDSIRDTIGKIYKIGEMQFGKTEENELIIFDVLGENTLHISVVQNNGWIRHNYYNTVDHSVTETYEKQN